MCIVACFVGYIAHVEQIQLNIAAATGDVYRKQNRPSHTAAHEADDA